MRRTVWSPLFFGVIYVFILSLYFIIPSLDTTGTQFLQCRGVLYTIDSKTIRISAGHIVTDV
jgi:hypothetical protein